MLHKVAVIQSQDSNRVQNTELEDSVDGFQRSTRMIETTWSRQEVDTEVDFESTMTWTVPPT